MMLDDTPGQRYEDGEGREVPWKRREAATPRLPSTSVTLIPIVAKKFCEYVLKVFLKDVDWA